MIGYYLFGFSLLMIVLIFIGFLAAGSFLNDDGGDW